MNEDLASTCGNAVRCADGLWAIADTGASRSTLGLADIVDVTSLDWH